MIHKPSNPFIWLYFGLVIGSISSIGVALNFGAWAMWLMVAIWSLPILSFVLIDTILMWRKFRKVKDNEDELQYKEKVLEDA